MIRATIPTDTPTLLRLTEATGVFKPMEVVALVGKDRPIPESKPGVPEK